MGKPSAPKSPDPQVTAAAQTGSNVSTAIAQQQLNMMNQVGPNGNVTYDQSGTYKFTDPSTGKTYTLPKMTQTTTLSPEQQALYDTSNKTQQNLANTALNQSGRLDDLLSKPFSLDGLPAAGNAANINTPNYQQYASGPQLNTTGGQAGAIQTSLGTDDYSADRQKVEDALMARLNPQLDQDRSALEQRLADQGIQIGTAAYDRAMGDFGQNVNDARTAAVLNAGQEQNRLQQLALNAGNFANSAQQQQFEQTLANAGFGNAAQQQEFTNQNQVTGQNNQLQDSDFANQQAMFNLQNQQRQQAMNEQLTQRNQGLNEIIGLASGSQVQQPQFNSTPQTGLAGTDVAGITQQAYSNDMNAYNQQMQSWNSTIGGLFGLGASALKFSDRRLKTNIEDTGASVAGVPIKTWDWKGSGRSDVGVIAQDVERKHPGLVDKSDPSGFRRVNYGGLMRLGASAAAARAA